MHDHNHDRELQKLEAWLPHTVQHHQEHIKSLEKWIERARHAHQEGVAGDLDQVLELYRQMTPHLDAALAKLHE